MILLFIYHTPRQKFLSIVQAAEL